MTAPSAPVRRRLRIGLPAGARRYQRFSGVGMMWHHVLTQLAAEYRVRFVDPPGRLPRRRPDAWLQDGHQGPLPVVEPIVCQLHEAAWHDPDTKASLDPAFVATYEDASRRSALAAARVIVPSNSSRDQVVAEYGVEPRRVVVAPHGVDHEVFRPGAPGAAETLARVGADVALPYVLFVSQLHPRKNLETLRSAMAQLARDGYPHVLVIVGGPPMDRLDSQDLRRAAVAELPGAPGRVVHIERLPEAELAGLMAGAAAFCLPSFMEGFGLTALEAMASGVPVVVSDRGALPEVVGDAGIVTSPTPAPVAAALAEVLDDREAARRLGQRGHERAQAFTWRRTAAIWRGALDEAIRER